MNYTGYTINGKVLPTLSLGCMRFLGRESAAEAIAACAEEGIPYLDTAPGYSYRSEEENCESWGGAAIQGIRDKFIVSAKSATGGGGNEVGEYSPSTGFSITTADQVRRQIEQSLTRLQIDKLDYYQLWAVHAPNLFDEAVKPGGWLEGALKAQAEGLFTHLGITGHGDTEEVKRWIDSGYFSMVTIPFQMLENSRLEAVRYARDNGVAVIAMNPLAGGLLGSPSEALAQELADLGVTSAGDLALRYSASFPGVSALCGMASAAQVRANVASVSKPPWSEAQCAEAKARFDAMLGSADYLCTACEYCMPCPQGLNIPSILTLRNYHRVLKLENAARAFTERHKYWGVSHQANRCTACGACEKKCPNILPVSKLMADVMETLGTDIPASTK